MKVRMSVSGLRVSVAMGAFITGCSVLSDFGSFEDERLEMATSVTVTRIQGAAYPATAMATAIQVAHQAAPAAA